MDKLVDRKSADEGRNIGVTRESKSSEGSFDANAVSTPPGFKMNDAMANFMEKAAVAPAATPPLPIELLPVEARTCRACEGSMVEGRGKLAGRWACGDVSCSMYGITR